MVEEISDPAYASVQGLVKHAVDDESEAPSGGSSGGGGIGKIFGKIPEFFRSLMP